LADFGGGVHFAKLVWIVHGGNDNVARNAVNERRFPLVRNRPAEQIDQVNAHATKVGRTVVEWNELSTSLFRLFWLLVGDRGKRPKDLATDLWQMSPSDGHQRRLLTILAENTLFDRKPALSRTRWLIAATNGIAQYRNIGVHTPTEFAELPSGNSWLTFATDGVRPSTLLLAIATEHHQPKFWDFLQGDLYALSQYAFALALHIANPQFVPVQTLPYKPRLLSLPARTWASQITRKQPRLKRKRRRAAWKRKS
jgi:hypothetical protein